MLKNINSAIVFFMELCMLYAFGLFGYYKGSGSLMKYVLAILLPAIVIILWAIWAAPKSNTRLESPYQYIFRTVLFLAAAYFLYACKQPIPAIVMAILTIVTQSIAYYYKS